MTSPIELIPFEKPTPLPDEGDVFCFQAKGMNNIYGQVIRWVKVGEWDGVLVRIFRPLAEEDMEASLPFSATLLLPPIILDPIIWKRNYLRLVPSCDYPLPAKERYSFWDPTESEYVDETRKVVRRPSKPVATYGLTTLTGFSKALAKALC